MNEQRIALGLDVSKRTVDACLLFEDGQKLTLKITNSKHGFEQLMSWLQVCRKEDVHACLEPTGKYSVPIAFALHDAGFRVSQVHSYAVKHHGRSKKFRSKTDRIDAFLLADYCLKENPSVWTPAPDAQRQLRELQHRLAKVDELIRQEENRLEAGSESELVVEDIKDSLGRLYVRQRLLERAAKELIRTDERLSPAFTILSSIVGIGDRSVIRMLAFVRFEEFKHGRQVARFAGLEPAKHDSGTSVHHPQHISKMGNSELRAALYFPAMVAIQHNPQMRAFADRLRARNKPPKVIICAVMRKLLVLSAALLRKQEFYDPAFGLN